MAIVKKLKQHPPLPSSRYEVGIYCLVSTASKTQVVSAGHQLSGLIADVANSQQVRLYDVYKMSRPNVQKILYKNVQLVCLS